MKTRISILCLLCICQFVCAQLPITDGWTVFTPSSDSRIIYVSATGNDATAQVYATSSPEIGSNPLLPTGTIRAYQTIDAAKTQLRNGFPDWLLFKKGETFTNQSFGVVTLYGRNANEPMLIGSYGNACERPIILTGNRSFMDFRGVSASFMAIAGLYAEPHTRTGNDDPVGINILNTPFDQFLVEDCRFNLFHTHFVVQDYSAAEPYTHKNFKARRNILTDAYQLGGGGGGLYMHRISDILFEENLIDHNGWRSTIAGAPATGFSHNTYFQSSCRNLVFRNNIVARASAVGGGHRSGGIIQNNLYLSNPRNILIGSFDQGQINFPTEAVSAEVAYNVVLDARPEPSFNDFGNGISIERARNVRVHHNIIAHFTAVSNYNTGIGVNKVENMDLSENIIYKWGNNRASGFDFANGLSIGTDLLGTNTIRRNDIQMHNTQGYCVNTNGSFARLVFSQNRYHNVVPSANNWFAAGNFSNWVAASGETGAVQSNVNYTDPERNISTFLTHIGTSGTLNTFLTTARTMSKCNWNTNYTANTVNNYIREGFNIANPVPITLTSFFGKLNAEKQVELYWTTASEQNNKGFEIQRSQNATDFETIGFVFGKTNSTTSVQYRYTDKTPSSGLNYYRLKQIDWDGTSVYSKTITIETALKNKEISLFPNPTEGNITILGFEGMFKDIQIINQSGCIVKALKTLDNALDISELPSGLYFIRVKTGIETVTKRIIKQ